MAAIQKRTRNGKTSYRVRYRDPTHTQRSKSFDRRVDAERFARTVEVEKDAGTWVDPTAGRTLLNDWRADFIRTEIGLRDSTRQRDASFWRANAEASIGRLPLSAIDYSTTQSWVSDLTDRLAPATVLKNYQILSKTLNGAVKAGMIPANRASGIQLPSIEVKEQHFLTPPEVNTLAESIDPRYRTLVLTMAYGGLRRGEAFALRRSRVDLMRRHLDVVEATREVAGTSGVQFGPPKTKAGHRQVPLPRVVIDELIPEIAPMESHQLVWSSPNGEVLRSSFRSRFWMPAVKRAGLDGLRLHDLRHTAVSLWIHAGTHNKAVAKWAGHASVASVIDRYGHLMPDTADPVMAALDAMSTTTDAQVIGLHG